MFDLGSESAGVLEYWWSCEIMSTIIQESVLFKQKPKLTMDIELMLLRKVYSLQLLV